MHHFHRLLYSSMDVTYSEGPVNLNWGTIMKTVQEDTKSFFSEGGWSFLQAESDAEQSEESGTQFQIEMMCHRFIHC